MARLQELQKKYRELLGTADAIRKEYTNTDKNMTDEESAKFDAILEDSDKVWADIEREQKALAIEARERVPAGSPPHPTQGEGGAPGDEVGKEQLKAFSAYLRGGKDDAEYAMASAHLKTLQADLDTSGGYLLAPQLFVQQLLKNVDDLVWMRGLATKFTLDRAESLGVPSIDTQLNDADWTTELATGSQDDTTAFGKRELRPHPFAKRVKVSNKLLRQSLMDPEALVRERMAYKFGLTEEKAFLTGTGAGQPLGIFTASVLGISTARDITVGTTTAITADGLIDVKHGMKVQYWPKMQWLLHRDAIKMIRKLKDGTGQYLWQPGLAGGIPNTILDQPYKSSEFVPNTFTTGLYVGALGDFSFYWIADAMGLSIQRVVELYAESDVTGFIGRAEADGMPVLEEAFARLTLA